MWNLSNRMAAWAALLFVDFRNGFHISITARRTLLLLLSPKNAKNISMLSSERSLPPNQIARRRSRSLTTIRYVWPFRIEISSMPMTLGPGLTSPLDLLAHVLHLECLDGFPIEEVFLGHVSNRRVSTASTNMESKALGVERVVGQPVKPLLLHSLAAPAVDPTDGDLKEDAHTSRRKISDTAQFAVIPPTLYPTTNSARSFFE